MARVLIIAGDALPIAAVLPGDIEAQLIIATGCGLDELDLVLSAGADRAAMALLPILAKPEDGAEQLDPLVLARRIASDPGAIVAIRDVYAELVDEIAAAPADIFKPRGRRSRVSDRKPEEIAS